MEERQEFWKPVITQRQELEQAAETAVHPCPNCGNELGTEATFCPACGANGQLPAVEFSEVLEHPWYDLAVVREALGQTTASLIAFVIGCACVIAAVFTSFMFNATTLLDWQAVQLWRIEWLLASVAMFVAGILLKKK
jgi:hypothetical protein